MKIIKAFLFLITFTTISFVLHSCSKDDLNEVTVVKHCTGFYLRIDNDDFKVCNREKLAPFSNGEKVSASYKMVDSCNFENQDFIVCGAIHPCAGHIQVEKIN